MRINSIVLKNLFSFYGEHRIDFRDRTAILAENGFGKTSILNSIKLALGQKVVKINSILNSSAEDRVCFISIDFDTFILTRFWNLDENFESLIVELKSSKKRFKDYEAEEYIREKFPLELVDFIFFDGEIERGSIISNSKKIKKVFELTFDLDILYNISVDTKKVATRMVKKVGSDEVNKFDNLYKSYIELNSLMDNIEDKRAKQSKSLRIINELIRLNELKIRNRSREIQDIQDKIDDNSQKLSEEIETFYKINLYQLPLLMNRELFKKLDRDKSQIIEILEKRDFEDRFNLFLENCNIKSDNLELLKKFYNIMDVDSQIKLEFSREDLINSLERLKDLTGRKKELERKLNDIKIKTTE